MKSWTMACLAGAALLAACSSNDDANKNGAGGANAGGAGGSITRVRSNSLLGNQSPLIFT